MTLSKPLMLGLLSAAALGLSTIPASAAHHGAEKATERFNTLDTDGNGTISREEFMAEADSRFSGLDRDDSGDLSQEELKARAKDMRGKMKEKMKEKKDKMMEYKENPASDLME